MWLKKIASAPSPAAVWDLSVKAASMSSVVTENSARKGFGQAGDWAG
jgi:hypothetical protein